MTTSRYELAKMVLTETEKDRLLACYLNTTDKNVAIDWQKAASAFGSASVDSFKKMIQNSFKKVDAAEAKVANGEAPTPVKPASAKGGKKRKAAAETEGDDAEETPKPKAKRGKKTKSATPDADGGDDAEEAAAETPKPKAKRGRKPKGSATPRSDGGDADGETEVKAEDSD